MPLLRKQPFEPNKPPHDLRPDEEVFYCKITNECFRDYEAFFERIILCNSLVWSCSLTGRSGLTYQEAIECESRARRHLATFPSYLQKPILYLVTLTHRSRLVDLNDDIFIFAKDRYFIGELVDVVTGGGERKTFKIVGIIPPPTKNGDVIIINDDSDEDSKGSPSEKSSPTTGDADRFGYLVQEMGKPSGTVLTVSASQISRKRGLYTRDKSKLFLKQHCYPEMGIWKVKESKLRELSLGHASFEDFFAGAPPAFAVSTAKKKRGKFNTPESAQTSPEDNKLEKKQKKLISKPKVKEEATPTESKIMSPEERANMKEQIRQEKLAMKEDMKKKIEEAKQKRKEEKAKEREKVREEKRQQAEILKEWSRPREDMECDDLKAMPQFAAVKTRIPTELFGDAAMILEFVSDFKIIFDYKQFFPKGFTWGMLESALMDSDVDGPLCDLLQMLLVAIFSLQEEEAEELQEMEKEEQNNQDKGDNREEYGGEEEELSANIMIESATTIALQQQQTHGMPLKEMLLDQYTLTEILRLHLMTSGAKSTYKNARFRYQQRGGYGSMDDAGLNLRLEDPGLIRALGTDNVFDLLPDKKLKLIHTLVLQILSYAAVRDFMEESYEKLRLLKYDLKQMQWAEQRREKEEAHAKYKKRMEEKNREREKRIEYLKQQEELKKTELNGDRDSPTPDSVKKGKGKTPLSEDQDNPSPLMPDFKDLDDGLTPEEREALRLKEEEEEARKKMEFAKKESDMIDRILEYQRTNALYPLGRDRHYRRYWLFNALRGVFVEDDEQYLFNSAVQEPEEKPETLGIPELTRVDEKSTSSDKENDSQGVKAGVSEAKAPQPGGDVVVISDSDSDPQPVEADVEMDEAPPELESFPDKIISHRKNQGPQWMYLESVEQLTELMSCLNPRGFREGQLRQVLADIHNILSRSIKECPKSDLNWQPDAKEDARVKALSLTRGISSRKTAQDLAQNSRASEQLELNLRELLLDMEERLFCGSLGFLKVRSREAWRAALENGGYDPQTDDATFARPDPKFKLDGESDSGSMSESVAKDLARALCQLRRSIESKFFIPPLGEENEASRSKKRNREKKKPKEERDTEAGNEDAEAGEDSSRRSVVERWEESLLQCSSLSQLYLHLSTLEKSVAWSRSALHARCRICRRKGDAERMLLCDGCDRGHHTYCLKPPVEKVPEGDWYCPDCRPKESRRSPRKGKRRTFSDELSEEEEENEEEEEKEDEEEDSDRASGTRVEDEEEPETSMADPNENVCAVCGKDGMLLCCDHCPRSFHLGCARPPLKKVPKGKWQCQLCSQERVGKIKLGRPESKTPTGRRVGRPPGRKNTPRTSPVPSSSRRRSSPAPSTSSGSRKRSSVQELEEEEVARGKRRSGPKTPTSSLTDMEGGPKHYVSSYRGNTNVQKLKLCEELVNDLIRHADAWPFLKPVNKRDVPDYYEVIKNPMDLSTIRNKIHRFGYTETSPMIDDVRLIFANCLEYNNRNTPEYKAGIALSKYFERKLKELSLDAGHTPIPPVAKKARKS